MDPGTLWVHHVAVLAVVPAQTNPSSSSTLQLSDWEGACGPELDRPEVGTGNVEAAGTCPGTHKNDLSDMQVPDSCQNNLVGTETDQTCFERWQHPLL